MGRLAVVQTIKKKITGLTIPKEYCCIDLQQFRYPIKAKLVANQFERDITDKCILLGYKPLIIGIPSNEFENYPASNNSIRVEYTETWGQTNRKIAVLHLKRIDTNPGISATVLIFEGIHGSHKFLSAFQQAANRIREQFHQRPAGNVALSGNLLDQVQIAYATPRKISVITVGQNNAHNMFPTDLHGTLSPSQYISSLRIGGLASEQVELTRNILISEVSVSEFKTVYAMGKNHMRPMLKTNDEVVNFSEFFKLPVPYNTERYLELQLKESIDCGLHRIHFYDTLNSVQLKKEASTLAHLHRVPLQWRLNNNLHDVLYFP